VLMQALCEEFNVVAEDGSPAEVAKRIISLREVVLGRGNVTCVKGMYEAWAAKGTNLKDGGGGVNGVEVCHAVDAEDDDEDDNQDDEDEDEDEDDDDDAEMGDAPPSFPHGGGSRRVEPEVDEDGFTKVVGKNRRRG
jgi:pre-rRNA-processing protein TSR2